MSIEGSLRELPIEDVLQLLDLSRKTGSLMVRSERRNDEAVIHFDQGRIVGVTQRWSSHRLGQQLLRAGKLTERELERALELQVASPSESLGRILLEMGSVTEVDLERQLAFQFEEAIYDLMEWEEGHFRFAGAGSGMRITTGVEVRIRVESLLMEGARRIDEWSRLESKVPDAGGVPVLVPADQMDPPPLDLRPAEWEVLAEIDGERDLRELAADLGMSSFDVAKTVYGLIGMGIVRMVDSGTPPADLDLDLLLLEGRELATQGRYRAATEAFARAAELAPLSTDAHDLLGVMAASIGDFDRATSAWEAYLRLSTDLERSVEVKEGLSAVRRLQDLLDRVLG